MSGEILALLDRDPAAGILAAADLREQQASGVRPDLPWHVLSGYIAAEANPALALAGVRRWRGVVERHARRPGFIVCSHDEHLYPCPDLTESADEVRAYLGGAP